jgi:hypothetical protein
MSGNNSPPRDINTCHLDNQDDTKRSGETIREMQTSEYRGIVKQTEQSAE